MIRVQFKSQNYSAFGIYKWPFGTPFWIHQELLEKTRSIVYCDSLDRVLEVWPDAEIETVDHYDIPTYCIPVFIKKDVFILMKIRTDCNPNNTAVVLVDPVKLGIILTAINANELKERLDYYAKQAQRGLAAAIKQVNSDDYNPLPMANVNCFATVNAFQITFTDGIKRCTELVESGTRFIPVQISQKEAPLLNALIGIGVPEIPAIDFIEGRSLTSDF